MASGDGHDVRVSRVAKSLRDIIANRITRGLGDVPRGPVTITRVEVTRDFKLAEVYVSVFTPDGASERQKEELIDRVFEALENASQELVRETNKQDLRTLRSLSLSSTRVFRRWRESLRSWTP